jgi:hypothetical protein
MEPYAGVDCSLTLCPLQYMYLYHVQSYARRDLNPTPKSSET